MLKFLIGIYKRYINDIINQKTKSYGDTPLDCAYEDNDSPIREDIASLLRNVWKKKEMNLNLTKNVILSFKILIIICADQIQASPLRCTCL